MLGVQPYAKERDRAARRVESRIADELIVGRELQARPAPGQLQPVVGFENFFVCVAQAPVAEQKTRSRRRRGIRGARRTGPRPPPPLPTTSSSRCQWLPDNLAAEACQAIDLGERKAFRLAVVPAESRKHAGRAVIRERLLDIDPKPYFLRPSASSATMLGVAPSARRRRAPASRCPCARCCR